MQIKVFSFDPDMLRKDLLESIAKKALAMPEINLAELEKARCVEHEPEPYKLNDLWRFVWGLRNKCDVVDLSYLTQTFFCDACLKTLRVRPSEISEFIRTNPIIQKIYSRQKNMLTGQLALAEEEKDEESASRCRALLDKIENARSGKL